MAEQVQVNSQRDKARPSVRFLPKIVTKARSHIRSTSESVRHLLFQTPPTPDFANWRTGSSKHDDLYGIRNIEEKLVDLPWSEISKVLEKRKGVRLWNEIATAIDYTFPSQEQLTFVDESNAADEDINLEELRYCVKYAAYIYFMAFLGDPEDIKIKAKKDLTLSSDSNEPGYFIAIDYMYKRILLCIRGTTSMGDVLTDLDANMDAVDFGDGTKYHVHRGIFTSAKKIYFEATLKIKELFGMKQYRDFKLLVTGHSLGAGVCSLLGLLWNIRGTFDADRFRCYSFASPLVIDAEGMQRSKSYNNMISVAVTCDIVTRGCVEGILILYERTEELNSSPLNAQLVDIIVEARSSTNTYHEFKAKLQSESLDAFLLLKKIKDIDDRSLKHTLKSYHEVYLYPCGDILWFLPKFVAHENAKERYSQLAQWIKKKSNQSNFVRACELVKTIYTDFQVPEPEKDQKLASIKLQNKKGKNDRFEFTQMVVNGIEAWQAHLPGRYTRGFNISITDVFKLSGNYPTNFGQTKISDIENFAVSLLILVQGLSIFFFYNVMPSFLVHSISYAISETKRIIYSFRSQSSYQRKIYSRIMHRREVPLWNKVAAMCDYTFPAKEKLKAVKTTNTVYDELKYCVRYATYVHFMDLIGDPQGIQIKHHEPLRVPEEANPPAHFIGVDTEHRYIVLCIRGAAALGFDKVTLPGMKKSDKVAPRLQNCSSEKAYYVHPGIYELTMRIYGQTTHRIEALLEEYDGYKILVTGHGVGGGICSMFGFLWNIQQVFKQEQFASYAFGAPLVIGKNGRKESVSQYRNMISVTGGTDTASNLSFGGLLILQHRIRELKKNSQENVALVQSIVNKRCQVEDVKEFEASLSQEEKSLITRLKDKDDENHIDESLFLYPCGKTFWLFPSHAVEDDVMSNREHYQKLKQLIDTNKYMLEGYAVPHFLMDKKYVLTSMDSHQTETKFIRNISSGVESWKSAHFPLRYTNAFDVGITDVFKECFFYNMLSKIVFLPDWLLYAVICIHAVIIAIFYRVSLSSKVKNFIINAHVYPFLWMRAVVALVEEVWTNL